MATSAIVTISTATYSFMQPNLYTATATLLPVEKSHSNNLSTLMNSLGGLGAIASQAGLGSGADEKFLVLLQSRAMSEAVIAKLDVVPYLFKDRWNEERKTLKRPWFAFWSSEEKEPSQQSAVNALKKIVNFKKDKNRVVSINVTTVDPEFAAKIANSYVFELDNYLKNNTLSTSKRNRVFIETQLATSQKEMEEYELALKNFQQENKVMAIDAQTQASVKAYSDLKARLIASEVEAKILEKGSFEGEPSVTLKQQEVDELRKQLERFEKGSTSGALVSFQDAPTLALNYVRLKRELMVREKVFELLTQQFEMAKIQEAQEEISFQIVDSAIPPENKSGPRRSLTILVAFIASVLLGTLLAFVAEIWKNVRHELKQARGS